MPDTLNGHSRLMKGFLASGVSDGPLRSHIAKGEACTLVLDGAV